MRPTSFNQELYIRLLQLLIAKFYDLTSTLTDWLLASTPHSKWSISRGGVPDFFHIPSIEFINTGVYYVQCIGFRHLKGSFDFSLLKNVIMSFQLFKYIRFCSHWISWEIHICALTVLNSLSISLRRSNFVVRVCKWCAQAYDKCLNFKQAGLPEPVCPALCRRLCTQLPVSPSIDPADRYGKLKSLFDV